MAWRPGRTGRSPGPISAATGCCGWIAAPARGSWAQVPARKDTPEDAPLTAALNGPRSIDIGPDGTMYLILREGNKLYALDPKAGRLRHLGGTGEKGYAGDGGPARLAKWNGPKGIAYAPDSSS